MTYRLPKILLAAVLGCLAGCAAPLTYMTSSASGDAVPGRGGSLYTTHDVGLPVVGGGVRALGVVQSIGLASTLPSASGWTGIVAQYEDATTAWNVRVETIFADVSGVQRVDVESATDATDQKTISVECPPGKVILCGGTFTTLANDTFALVATTLVETPGQPQRWTATMRRIGDGTGSWGLGVVAICADPPPGYEVVRAPSAMAPDLWRFEGVDVPAGKRVLGGGARVLGDDRSIVLHTSSPDFLLSVDRWVAGAGALATPVSDWGLETVLICAEL